MDTIEVTHIVQAPARRIFEAWLNPEEHALMTGASTSGGESGAYTAWDGYIEAQTTSSVPYSHIEQNWRTSDFPEGSPDSRLVIELTEVAEGTEVKLVHSELPEGQGPQYEAGWKEHYFEPMERYFSSPREKLKEGVEKLEEAAEMAGEAIEHAVEQAGEAIETAKKNVTKALKDARVKATRQAAKAVKTGKRLQKKAKAGAKSFGKKVRSLVKGKTKPQPKKAATKRPAPSKTKKKR